jgi:hypothetical protein
MDAVGKIQRQDTLTREAEDELVEVGLKVLRLHGALVGAHQPALQVRSDPAERGQRIVAGSGDGDAPGVEGL